MSLRVLELKALQTNPRYSNNRCQILNMTNRGSVIGSNAKYGGAGCAKCSGGVRSTTCSSDSVLPNGCKNGCGCRFNGLSQPAPQMSYRNYLNKRSNAAYRPGGAPCCDVSGRITSVWKQTTGKTSASEVTEIKRLKALYCAATMHKQLVNPLTGKITCRSSVCGAYGHGPNCVCGWAITKAQRWFNRINHTVCGVTKTLPGYRTAGEQIALIKAAPIACSTSSTSSTSPVYSPLSFVGVWVSGSPIVIPFKNTTTCAIDWGDGTIANYSGETTASKNFGDSDVLHTIIITPPLGGTITFDYGDTGWGGDAEQNYRDEFRTVTQWGNYKCGVKDFTNCTKFTGFTSGTDKITPPQIGTDLNTLFRGCSKFNADISNWDTSNVTNMMNMFDMAEAFNNGDASGVLGEWITNSATGAWDTGGVTSMVNMFRGCDAFNQDMRQWNLSGLSGFVCPPTASCLFDNCQYFEEIVPLGWVRRDPNIPVSISNGQFIPFAKDPGLVEALDSNWPTDSLGNISNCNTFLIMNMSELFKDKAGFNSDISQWNTCRVTNMYNMFNNAETFNQNIGNWKPTPSAYAGAAGTMFQGATAFCASATAFPPYEGGSDGTNTWSKANLGC